MAPVGVCFGRIYLRQTCSIPKAINLDYKGAEYNIGDGGFVDWGEKLTGNKKERMLTSGLGTDFLLKLINGKL